VADEGWLPQHVLVRNEGTGQLVGACPMYLKSHSYGARVSVVILLRRIRVVILLRRIRVHSNCASAVQWCDIHCSILHLCEQVDSSLKFYFTTMVCR